ncbi:MAG: cyclic pyranopterin monophosphate synthase MoaC [Methanobacteriales archaeon]|nr:cyclic pyranopterin monophosphate synthase MoaC [Methanobacteriales archaeon]
MEKSKFTHLSQEGVRMVEVGEKPLVKRMALASGTIKLEPETIELIVKEEIKKGNVLTTAQIAAIQSVKNTSQLIPLCHPLSITGINVEFDVKKEYIAVEVEVHTTGQTGVEMEAITGVSVALLTIWDMVKSVEKDEDGQYPHTKITDIKVLRKEKLG